MSEPLSLQDFCKANDDIRRHIALFVEPEAWGDFSGAIQFTQFDGFFINMLLGQFSKILSLPGKDKEQSLFVLLRALGIQWRSPYNTQRQLQVWGEIKRIRANPASVAAEQKVLFALMFPRWIRSVLSEKERQVAYITAVFMQNIRNAPPAQERALASQLKQWLFSNQSINPLLSNLWRQGHIRLVLQEMLNKPQEFLNTLHQHYCFIELKVACLIHHQVSENSSIEALLERATRYDSIFSNSHVFELLALSGVDLRHIRVQDGSTLVHIAATLGHAAVVDSLLAAGVDVNLLDAQGRTALHVAVFHEHTAVLDSLLAAGADINLLDAAQIQTVLHWAVFGRHRAVVTQLLEAGVNPNRYRSSQGRSRTSLQLAVREGDTETAQLLLRHGAHPYVKPDDIKASGTDCAYLKQYYFSWHHLLKCLSYICYLLVLFLLFLPTVSVGMSWMLLVMTLCEQQLWTQLAVVALSGIFLAIHFLSVRNLLNCLHQDFSFGSESLLEVVYACCYQPTVATPRPR